MSKRHLEPDSDSSPMNHKSSVVPSWGILGKSEQDRMENFSGGRWRKSRMNSNNSSGCGSLKRPRPVSLKPFDFSLIKDEPGTIDSQIPYSERSQNTSKTLPSSGNAKVPDSSSPAVSIAVPPTMILPFLYLGSQNDALSKEFIKDHGITHILNASTSCPKSPFIASENFLQIPVNDSHTERLLPYFEDVKAFLDGCCKANGRALVHCLAGISRSPTLVIAYIMSHLRLSQDDAYRYVKRRRIGISPNFNFLGQLMEFESMLRSSSSHALAKKTDGTFQYVSPKKLEFKAATTYAHSSLVPSICLGAHAQSPTTAFAKLSFDKTSPSAADDKSEHQRSIVGNKEFNEVIRRSKPMNHESHAFDKKDQHYSGTCLAFPSMANPKNSASNKCSVDFQLGGANKIPQRDKNVSKSTLVKPVFGEHCSRKLCKTDAQECHPNSKRASPPVRPSSIAISGLQFDFGLLRQDVPLEFKGMILSDVEICKTPISSFVTEACKKLHMDCSHDLLKQVESACRSRSFNDIPTVAASALASNGAVFSEVCSTAIEAAKASSTGPRIDHVWHRALDGRTSNSSLSSVGSNSLHGSRELVQVS